MWRQMRNYDFDGKSGLIKSSDIFCSNNARHAPQTAATRTYHKLESEGNPEPSAFLWSPPKKKTKNTIVWCHLEHILKVLRAIWKILIAMIWEPYVKLKCPALSAPLPLLTG